MPGKHLSFLWQITKAIRRSKADIIFLHGSVHVPAAWLAKILSGKKQKIVVRETQANHLKTKLEWVALKLAMRLADKVVFLSKEYAADVKHVIGRKYKEKKVAVIPNGLDLNLYRPTTNIAKKEFVIGMQSRLVAIKDHETLLQAFAILKRKFPEIKLLLKIAGDGDHRETLEKLSHTLAINESVFFTGMLDEKELVNFLQTLDIYVHASLGETMSTAIMQAMACRLPVIASDVPGINNMIIDKKNGLLVPAKNADSMFNAFQLLMCDQEEKNKLADAAYTYAKGNLSNIVMFNSYKKIFY
jgi:glycosyltransferase involved in cell wall biosynthesis